MRRFQDATARYNALYETQDCDPVAYHKAGIEMEDLREAVTALPLPQKET